MNKYSILSLVSILALTSVVSVTHANRSTGSSGGSSNSTSAKPLTDAQLSCMKTATSTREAALRKSYVTLYDALLANLDTRAKALDAAWSTTDAKARKEARDAAWKTWKDANTAARDAAKNARETAWNTFKKSASSCKVATAEVETPAVQAE